MISNEKMDLVARRANLIMRREQDRCAFEHFVKMAIEELVAEGSLTIEDRSRLMGSG